MKNNAKTPAETAATRAGASRRKRGRPPKISREEAILASIRILETTAVEDFMIKTLAQDLGTSSMAIYNYFSSRDDLLEAVSDHICHLFVPPKTRGDWRKKLLAWLWALKHHADQYPVMPRVVGINGHTSAGWVRTTVPVVLILHDELGLRGKSLAMATYVFVSSAITMINMIAQSGVYMASKIPTPLEGLNLSDDQKRVISKLPINELDQTEVFDTVFAQLINGIASYIDS